jgi:hypothetical protein
MSLRDAQGNAASTASHEALAFAEKALWRMMSFYGTPADELDAAIAADPAWLLPRVMKAGFLLGLTEASLLADARTALAEAEPLAAQANERERAHLAAVKLIAQGDWAGAGAAWEEVLLAHPRDALALQWALLFDFYRGDARSLRERVARVLPQWSTDDALHPYVLGLHAFGLEESNLYAAAEDAGRRALAGQAQVPWAIHAVAHVMEMQGRHDEGRAWMGQWRPHWGEGNGFAGHLGWHESLFALETLDHEGALVPFDRYLNPQATEITLQRVDAASLLWRLHLLGADVGERWQALLAGWHLDAADAGHSAFNDVHALLALIGAGEIGRAAAWTRATLAAAEKSRGWNHEVMRDIGAPLMRGLVSFAAGRYDAAAETIHRVRPISARLGGSHAQRDVIDQTLLAAAVRGSMKAAGRALLNERLVARPRTPLGEWWARALAAHATP